MRTQVAIIGAGPSGLLLSHLLRLQGVDSILVEARSREYCENRIRAGVLEQGTVDTLNEAGLGDRMRREGLEHHGIELLFSGQRHRIDLSGLTGGRAITVYSQHEVVRDLIAAGDTHGHQMHFDVSDVALHDVESDRPFVTFTHADGRAERIDCDYIAGCDGFHGIARQTIPAEKLNTFERVYPFAWLGILADAAPSLDELVYAHHDNGFALFSMRSPTVTRLYLQCRPNEDLAEWSDARIWDELHTRFSNDTGWTPTEGPITQKSVTPMRSFVSETMQHGRLFLAGDAAHIVPPTGAKGMNLAVADVRVLSRALGARYRDGDAAPLERYSATCLERIWRAEHFSYFMTNMLHSSPDDSPFVNRLKFAELKYVTRSRAAAQSLAENYVGLPFDDQLASDATRLDNALCATL
ncbi:4-hydroxybenzoate 3-monooxygenase [Burkholderia vietnamiensis]|jgi:p-hydroxybenzoate 3-monooxygenase|uniref:4-hydroxybenzoate 3-monooxygenase n=1 Tax=Burkholderia vietnamiensis TaxID=60552 RepID=UPI00075A8DAB|nr:4-hydroxybenzoate 3-monooxygenase [Burkholderia vietnamiensis]AOK44249.1 4-hydroxybenzoate 3-monooxygenase [Burkholderia vietnamiensis]KVE16523.1 4-hydroxybenzoate 3-monooxygenase [Burkholderia vietnamiensis]MBR7908495.1 4-hydroxybenzoate 3-monooxygenase [Burkholderia vietnamiensis]MBR8279120.1 4-hydroxybenzoate 3-monooxygenase [Burkholderia vietnamiensis]MCA8193448.1 4-hydroxybenzoate 3-monooxygenase [Burkholderia vietnamiensis]